MEFRQMLLELGSRVLADLGYEAPSWTPSEVTWDSTSAAPPGELADMRFECHSLFDETIELLVLRESGATVLIEYLTSRPRTSYVVTVGVSFPPSQALAVLADQLQDHVIESDEAWGKPLPPCPRHPAHPLSARDDGTEAAWWCPQDDIRVRAVAAQ